MKQLRTFACAILLSLLPSIAGAQSQFDRLVGVNASVSVPHGIRLDAALAVGPKLSIRGGLSGIPAFDLYSGKSTTIDLSTYKNALGYNPELKTDVKASSLSGQLMLDYHPFNNGFRVTVGAFFSGPKGTARTQLINPSTGKSIMDSSEGKKLDPDNMPIIKFQLTEKQDQAVPGEYVKFQPSPDASMTASIGFTQSVQPYIGIGYGYAVPEKRISFMFDFGLVHTGKIQLTSPNAIEGDPNILFNTQSALIKARHYLQVLPVLNVGLAVRLF